MMERTNGRSRMVFLVDIHLSTWVSKDQNSLDPWDQHLAEVLYHHLAEKNTLVDKQQCASQSLARSHRCRKPSLALCRKAGKTKHGMSLERIWPLILLQVVANDQRSENVWSQTKTLIPSMKTDQNTSILPAPQTLIQILNLIQNLPHPQSDKWHKDTGFSVLRHPPLVCYTTVCQKAVKILLKRDGLRWICSFPRPFLLCCGLFTFHNLHAHLCHRFISCCNQPLLRLGPRRRQHRRACGLLPRWGMKRWRHGRLVSFGPRFRCIAKPLLKTWQVSDEMIEDLLPKAIFCNTFPQTFQFLSLRLQNGQNILMSSVCPRKQLRLATAKGPTHLHATVSISNCGLHH